MTRFTANSDDEVRTLLWLQLGLDAVALTVLLGSPFDEIVDGSRRARGDVDPDLVHACHGPGVDPRGVGASSEGFQSFTCQVIGPTGRHLAATRCSGTHEEDAFLLDHTFYSEAHSLRPGLNQSTEALPNPWMQVPKTLASVTSDSHRGLWTARDLTGFSPPSPLARPKRFPKNRPSSLGSGPMRIGFDMAPAVIDHSRGVGRVCLGLVCALEERGQLEVIRLSPKPGTQLRRWKQAELPALVKREGLAGIHSFTSAFALRARAKRVQTVHELPWLYGVDENSDWRHRAWARFGGLRADRIVTPSQHVARELGKLSLTSGKIETIPWGVDASFQPDPPAGVIDEAVLERYRLGDDPYLLAPGADRQKKNLRAVLDGLAELKSRGETRLRLVITGKDTQDLRRDLGHASRLGLSRWISTLGELEEKDFPSLIRLSEAVCVLSHSEGFGLSVLEALACAVPVLVPPDSAQAELAGEGGFICQTEDPKSVADAIERALSERHQNAPKALQRASEFSWERCAEKTEALWRELQ